MQTRLRDYEEEILSFDHNIFNLGLHNPGRYAGFDTLFKTNTLTFVIKHTNTGISYKNPVNNVIGPCGVLLTPQGVIIMEDEDLSALTIDTNAGNNTVRYDLVVCSHNHAVSAGGTAATYSVIKGALGSPILPIVPDPLKQIPVGVIIIPANAVDIADCTYEKTKCPDSGDGEDARLSDPNIFTSFQGFKSSDTAYPASGTTHTSGLHTAKLWELDNDGNTFKFLTEATNTIDGIYLKGIPLQEGMRINILTNNYYLLRESRYFEASDKYALGYRGFTINPGIGNYPIASPGGGGSLLGIKPTVGEIWDIELVFKDNRWFVSKIGGAGTSSAFQRGMQMEWFGDVATNFDDTGLGINLMSGWQICNGNLGSPDRRGKASVMATDVPSAGAFIEILNPANVTGAGGDPEDYIYGAPGSTQGKTAFLIEQGNLPDVEFTVTDPGHTHTYLKETFSSHPGGASQSDPRNQVTANTGSSTTGISVASGGNDERLEHIQPCWMTIIIFKL